MHRVFPIAAPRPIASATVFHHGRWFQALAAMLASIPADRYYVDADTARDALRRRSMLNMIDLASGWKVDLIVRKNRAFSRDEFARRMNSHDA